MASIASLQKQAQKASKFLLAAFNPSSGGFVYVSDRNKTDEHLTENIANAALFSFGFDDEEIKEKAWSLATGFEFLSIPK